jgi:CBS domain-containing protein
MLTKSGIITLNINEHHVFPGMSTVDDTTSNLQLKKGKQRKKEARWQENNGNAAEMINYFYRYSDYSTQAIAEHLSMPLGKVQKIVDELIKSDALEAFIEESTTKVEKIMSEDVISLDYSKSVVDAAALMAKNEIGSIIVMMMMFLIAEKRDAILVLLIGRTG